MLHCAIEAGLGSKTHVQGIGDGAPFAEQLDRVLGRQGYYWLDFYHVCDSLVASHGGAPEAPSVWLKGQKQYLKRGYLSEVLHALKGGLEPATRPDQDAPVRSCYRYLAYRAEQGDYRSTIEAELPIGSGEIESAPRYIIQQHLKSPVLGGNKTMLNTC